MKLFSTRLFPLTQKILKFQCLHHSTTWKQFASYLGKWETPQGYDTGITIYNSAINKKVPLISKRENFLTWYMCGPTVYAESHIGHASCYVKFDVIRRVLEKVFGINILLLLGITDIDDKIIRKANEAGVHASHLAKKFELDFFHDMKALKVLPPTAVSRVSENIPLIISFCEKLIQTDFAYVTSEGNVYFAVSKGTTADILNETPDGGLPSGIVDPLKKDPRDFALWKTAKPDEPFWESPWGKGRPGWHIECSAMASKVFGSEIDLHSGGFDLLFPHHANEKSQSEAFHGCSQWVNYWMHSGLLQVDDELKMSKSLGNTISIKDFLKEHHVNDFRILCLQSLYRKNFFYSSETLAGAKSLHKKLHNFINDCESYIFGELKGCIVDENKLLSKLSITMEQVTGYLKDDFNTSQALLSITDFVDEVNANFPVSSSTQVSSPSSILCIANCYFYVNNILEIFGVSILTKKTLPKELPYVIDAVVKFRNKIRLLALNPKCIGTSQSAGSYITEAFRIMELEVNLIDKSQSYHNLIEKLLGDSRNFYNKAYEFSVSINVSELHDMKTKEARKKMAPLFTLCDELRSNFNEKGIGIKDRGEYSSWLPLTELQKFICCTVE